MKNKIKPVAVLYVALSALLVSLACQSVNVPFLATPTPTLTLTPTRTPRPTATPSPTLPPMPDLSQAVLTLDDLPDSFEFIEPPESTEMQLYYSFMDPNSFQILVGASTAVLSSKDQIGFDTWLHNPDIMVELFNSDLGEAEFTDIRPIEGLDAYGEESSGSTAETDIEGLEMVVEFFIMRDKTVGVFFFNIYRANKAPSITTQELADILDAKVARIEK